MSVERRCRACDFSKMYVVCATLRWGKVTKMKLDEMKSKDNFYLRFCLDNIMNVARCEKDRGGIVVVSVGSAKEMSTGTMCG